MERINQSPNLIAVVPSDTTVYSPALVGLRVTVSGTLVVVSGGQTITLTPAANETIMASINKVLATGTAATGINGFQWPE